MDKMFSPATLTPQRMKKGVEKEMTENRKRPQERFCHSNYVVLVLLYQKKESSSMKTQREAKTVVWFWTSCIGKKRSATMMYVQLP
jgi:hypothetical protein